MWRNKKSPGVRAGGFSVGVHSESSYGPVRRRRRGLFLLCVDCFSVSAASHSLVVDGKMGTDSRARCHSRGFSCELGLSDHGWAVSFLYVNDHLGCHIRLR